jgi:hypothetical protein
LSQPSDTFLHPVTGFHVASVHSILVPALMTDLLQLQIEITSCILRRVAVGRAQGVHHLRGAAPGAAADRRVRQGVYPYEAPQFRGVLDEAVLLRPIGGPEVMRRQLLRLAEASEPSNVTIRVLPFEVGAHRALEGPGSSSLSSVMAPTCSSSTSTARA